MATTSSKDLRLTGIIDDIYSGDYQLPEFVISLKLMIF